MSHLEFPRLHFRGSVSVNVGTANNDDLGDPQFVDTANVRVDLQGMTDAQFSAWLKQQDTAFGIRGGWNVYGNGDFKFQNVTCHAIELTAGSLAVTPTDDPVINAPVNLVKSIMVDLDPKGTDSTQIFADEFLLQTTSGLRIIGQPSRAYSRWIGLRNLRAQGFGAFAAVWHSVLLPGHFTITPGASASLAALQALRATGNGLMIRYCTYLLNPLVSQDTLAANFAAGLKTTNPAIGHLVGTIGVWRPTEMKTFAEGRRLNGSSSVNVHGTSVTFNPATVRMDSTNQRISLDLVNSIPEVDDQLQKVDVGSLSLVLDYKNGGVSNRAILGAIKNTRDAYETRAGLVDFDVDAAVWPYVSTGQLRVIQDSTNLFLLDEVRLVLETDDRAVYLQQNGSAQIVIKGWLAGRPAGGLQVRILQYVTTNKSVAPVPPTAPVVQCPDFVNFSPNGDATITVVGVNPGCCLLAFLGPDEVNDSREHFACVRVLALDDYSHIPDNQIDFPMVFREVLQYYHLLHPAMDIVADLSNDSEVENKISTMRERLLQTGWEKFAYMPRTRDLSAGKLALLKRWFDIVSPP